MWGARVRGVMLAACPDLMEQKCTGVIGGTVQIELQATLFFARGADESAKLGLKQQVLALFRAERDNQSESAFGELDDSGANGAAACAPHGPLPCLTFGHDGGDCTPTGGKSNQELWGML